MSTGDEVQVTVVVVTWNGAHLLADCLDGLREQDLAHRVLVVDNASTDGTLELLARNYPEVEILRSDRNTGFAGGATLGLRHVTSPFAAVLNNDARPDPAWLGELVAAFDALDVAAVTSKVLLQPRFTRLLVAVLAGPPLTRESVAAVLLDDEDVTSRTIAERHGSGLSLLVPTPSTGPISVTVRLGSGGSKIVLAGADGPQGAPAEDEARVDLPASARRVNVLNSTGGVLTSSGHGADRGYLEVDQGQYDEQHEVFALCGAAAAFRTEIGRELGWFDPWLFAYYEDLDLSWRLRARGYTIRYAPRAVVRHRHAATSSIGSEFFVFHNVRNRLVVLTRNAGVLATARMLFRRAGSPPMGPSMLPGPGGPATKVLGVRHLRAKVKAVAAAAHVLPHELTHRPRTHSRPTTPAPSQPGG
jgi:GT2 family glycosyltransferase